MHQECFNFLIEIRNKMPELFINKRVLEAGSLDINGTARFLFTNSEYIGLDLQEGKGVDIVSPIHEYKYPSSFDAVVSTEMLEHDKHWKDSLKVMYDNLKSKGMFLFTCAGPTRPEHGTTRTDTYSSPFTTDYYKNISVEDFESVLPKSLFSIYNLQYYRGQEDLYFFGIKQ